MIFINIVENKKIIHPIKRKQKVILTQIIKKDTCIVLNITQKKKEK